jgi:hypothetical protein
LVQGLGINKAGDVVGTALFNWCGSHVAATPATLWPPDGTMRPVRLAVAAHDDREVAPHCTIVDIAAVEDQKLLPTQFDGSVTGDLSVLLRATRSGTP